MPDRGTGSEGETGEHAREGVDAAALPSDHEVEAEIGVRSMDESTYKLQKMKWGAL